MSTLKSLGIKVKLIHFEQRLSISIVVESTPKPRSREGERGEGWPSKMKSFKVFIHLIRNVTHLWIQQIDSDDKT